MRKRKTIVGLVICMVLSMFMGIPLKASAKEPGETGLFVKDWIEWDENDHPYVPDEAEANKETWVEFYKTLYLGYAESEEIEENELKPVSANDISVQFINGETAEDAENKVEYKANGQNPELIDFIFYEVGDYTITYNNSDVTVHVDYPEIGFYTDNKPTGANLIRDEFKYSDSDNTFYMIFHRFGWSKLDLDTISFKNGQEEITDISEYFTIKEPENISFSEDASYYEKAEDYVYEVQINEGMTENFWLNVEVQKTDIVNMGDDDNPDYQFDDNNSYTISSQGIDITPKMEGLIVKDWIDWNDDDPSVPSVNPEASAQKETWADLSSGATLYLGYIASEGEDPETVTANKISVQFNGEDEEAGEDKVVCKQNEQNSEVIDFTFYDVGDYKITYLGSSVIIHVNYPEIGFYTGNEPTAANLIRDEFKYSDSDNTFYMIFHRFGWSKLDLNDIKYRKDGEEVDISEYFTITTPSNALSLSANASAYLNDEDYVYKVQIKKGMTERFWFNVEVQKTDIDWDDDEKPSFNDESYSIDSGMNIIPKAEGLVVAWAEWNEDDNPVINEYDGFQKEAWSDLYGTTVYLGYAANGETDPVPVSVDKISVQYDGTAAGNDKVTYKANEQNSDFIDFEFYKIGDYIISYTNGGKSSSVTIHVDYGNAAWFETNELTEAGLIRGMNYDRGTEKTFYIVPRKDDITSCSYTIETLETPVEGRTYITVDGSPLDPEKEMTGPAKITITADAKGSFGLKANGSVIYTDGHDEGIDLFLWCEDTYESTLIEDGKEHNGFAGCFISKEMYDVNGYDPTLSDMPLYWVHADTLQDVVDELVKVAEKGSVTVNGQTYTIENSGYMWANVSYFPRYKENATKPQYVTTPSDIEGIIVSSDFETYYTEEKDDDGSYYQVKLWKNGNIKRYTCLNYEDEKYYPVTKTDNDVFNLQKGGTGKTREEMEQEGFELDEEYGINPEWPELHVDATTNVKITGYFAEAAADRANVYLGLYEDSDIESHIMVGLDEAENIKFQKITKADIGKEVTTENGLKVKVVKLAASYKGTTVAGDFISEDAVTIEEEDGQALRDKIDIEEAIAGNEELKKAIIDGETLDVSMNVKTIEESETQTAEGIGKIAALVKTGKNDTSKIQYLDIGLKYQVGKNQGDITETKEDITISIELPKDFAKADRELAKSWKPVVYRYHDGKAERLKSTFEDGKLKFATGKFSVYAVAIEEVVPTGIKITTPPTKTTYTEGDTFDKTGMVVEALYSDASSAPVTDYTVSPAAFAATDKEVTISWHGKTAKQAVTVKAKAATPGTPVTQEPEVKPGDTVTSDGNTYQVTTATSDKKEVAYKGGDKDAKKVTIPSSVTIDGTSYTVTEIAANSFSGKKKMTSVTIPASVVKIGDNAFKNCAKLTKVTIPKNVTTIGKNAFSGCKQLKTVTIKGTALDKIDDNAFKNCTKLTKVTIPKNVTTIGKNAFSGCKQLKTITIKSTKLKTVGKNAFKGTNKNTTIKVPKSKKTAYTKLFKKAGFKGKVK